MNLEELIESHFAPKKGNELLIKLIEENNWIIAANGALFRTDNSSVVCEVLTDWFNKRVEYKNKMKKAYKSTNYSYRNLNTENESDSMQSERARRC